jgi:hypothetical protein
MEQEEEHGHGHHEHDETRIIDTGHGSVELSIFEEGQPPHWRLRTQRQEMGSQQYLCGHKAGDWNVFSGFRLR